MKISLPKELTEPAAVRSNGNGNEPKFSQPWVRPITKVEELEAVKEAAAADEHRVIAATHLVERGGEVIGYGSIGGAMMLHVWLSTHQVRARESLGLLNLAENLAALKGAQIVCMPCASTSPFRNYMEGFGYDYAGETGLFLKRLK